MSYIKKNLIPGEQIIHFTRITAFVFLPWLLLAIAAGCGSFFVERYSLPFWAIVIVATLCFFRMMPRYLYYLTSEFAITNRRVLGKVGIMDIVSIDILVAKVESMKVRQDITGQLFNFGDVEVTGTGGTVETLMLLSNPSLFRNKLEEAIGFGAGANEKAAARES